MKNLAHSTIYKLHSLSNPSCIFDQKFLLCAEKSHGERKSLTPKEKPSEENKSLTPIEKIKILALKEKVSR